MLASVASWFLGHRRSAGTLVLVILAVFQLQGTPSLGATSALRPVGDVEGTLAVRAIALNSTASFGKWQDMMNRARTTPASARWLDMMAEFTAANGINRLAIVNHVFNRVTYRADSANWGQGDYWASPEEFLARGAGDCEDYAIAKYMALRELGYGDDDLYVLTYNDLRLGRAHTVLVVRYVDKWLVLDNRWRLPMPLAHYAFTKPLYLLNQSSAWWLAKAE